MEGLSSSLEDIWWNNIHYNFFFDDRVFGEMRSLIKGIIKGCQIANCELVGGETAEMPGTYEVGKFDIAGFSVGIVDKKKILTKCTS